MKILFIHKPAKVYDTDNLAKTDTKKSKERIHYFASARHRFSQLNSITL